ncbi:hypothetical protein RRF57_009166 [Xylaria bambusicola]|uniref:Uncharacterized protein n=1 Tax=Xylaria bambusicola TaxID=326684 RepID=A0AAN7Z7N0_9PEZI
MKATDSPDPPFLEPQNTPNKYILDGAYVFLEVQSTFSIHITAGGAASSNANEEPWILGSGGQQLENKT